MEFTISFNHRDFFGRRALTGQGKTYILIAYVFKLFIYYFHSNTLDILSEYQMQIEVKLEN